MKFDRGQPEPSSTPRADPAAGRRTRRVCPRRAIAAAALLWAGSPAGAAVIEVEATLSARAVELGTPVALSLTALSDAATPSLPDLSPLETDFRLIDRRVERQTAITNGVRRERLRLRVMLLPRRSGTLEIPALDFGETTAPVLTLEVAEPAARPVESSAITAQTAPGALPATPGPWVPPWPGPGAWTSGALAPVQPMPADPRPSPHARAEPPSAGSTAGISNNPWFWISLALGVALLWSLFVYRGEHGGRRSGPIARTEPAADGAPSMSRETPTVEIVTRLRAAYGSGNATRAREAWLDWGRLRWPQDPPGNLARLAQRCPPELAGPVRDLERAFFSPVPLAWAQGWSETVADGLTHSAATRADGEHAQR